MIFAGFCSMWAMAFHSGRFFFHVMASLAEMEREPMVERTQAGLAAARKLGRKGGRRRQMTEAKVSAAKSLLSSGAPPREVAKNLGVSVPTLYRWVPASTRGTALPSPEMQVLGKPATDSKRAPDAGALTEYDVEFFGTSQPTCFCTLKERGREPLLKTAELRGLRLKRGRFQESAI